MRAVGCRCAVVVVVVVVVAVVAVSVVVQPTSAITQTPKTTGINFFMSTLLPETPRPFDSFFGMLKPRRSSVNLCSNIDNAARGLYY
jgi:hypothetical protein